jgi:hypothetical protein
VQLRATAPVARHFAWRTGDRERIVGNMRILLTSCVLLLAVSLHAGFAGTDLFLPAVGRVSGSGGAEFYTTVWITNPSSSNRVTVSLRFLRSGVPNPSPATVSYTLEPGETRLLENIGETVFAAPGVLGALRVVATADVLVSARIYNQASGAPIRNTQGLFFGGIPASLALAPGESALIQGVSQSADFRYNFFAVETTGQPVTMRMKLRDSRGAVVAQKDYPLGPFQQILAGVTDIQGGFTATNATLEASVIAGPGQVIVAGSQTANESQDGSAFEMAFRPIPNAMPFTLNGLSGDVRLSAGPNVSINPSGNTLVISAANGSALTGVTAGAGLAGGGTAGNVTVGIADGGVTAPKIAAGQVVKSINGRTDAVTLNAGANVTITPSGNTLTISSAAGSGPPSGAAGGVLTGSYPDPEIATGRVVRVLKVEGTSVGLTDSVTLAPGERIAFGVSGSTLTVNGTGVATNGSLLGNGTTSAPLRLPERFTSSTSEIAAFDAYNSSTGYGLRAYSQGGAAVYARAGFGSTAAVEADGLDSAYAGLFFGDVRVSAGNLDVVGTLTKSAGSFRIDHPLDPENKYLSHSFVESPDMMNIYNGNVVLDAGGTAVIELPEWFSALNRDFRYQLTAIGSPSPNVHVADEIAENRFRIAGGTAGGRISWQVTGIRRDAYAEAHRIPVEQWKPEGERGLYLQPEAHGASEALRITPVGGMSRSRD